MKNSETSFNDGFASPIEPDMSQYSDTYLINQQTQPSLGVSPGTVTPPYIIQHQPSTTLANQRQSRHRSRSPGLHNSEQERLNPRTSSSSPGSAHRTHRNSPRNGKVKRFLLTRDPKDRRLSGNGLGMKVIGGKDTPGCPWNFCAYIARIHPGGVAQSLGQLREGDLILEWNGVSLTGRTYEEVQTILSQSEHDAEVEIVVKSDVNMITGEGMNDDSKGLHGSHRSSDNYPSLTLQSPAHNMDINGNRNGYDPPYDDPPSSTNNYYGNGNRNSEGGVVMPQDDIEGRHRTRTRSTSRPRHTYQYNPEMDPRERDPRDQREMGPRERDPREMDPRDRDSRDNRERDPRDPKEIGPRDRDLRERDPRDPMDPRDPRERDPRERDPRDPRERDPRDPRDRDPRDPRDRDPRDPRERDPRRHSRDRNPMERDPRDPREMDPRDRDPREMDPSIPKEMDPRDRNPRERDPVERALRDTRERDSRDRVDPRDPRERDRDPRGRYSRDRDQMERDHRDPREMDVRDMEHRERDPRVPNEMDPRDRDPRDYRERDPRERDLRDPRERDLRDPRDPREPSDLRDPRERDFRDPMDQRDTRERDPRDRGPRQRGMDPRQREPRDPRGDPRERDRDHRERDPIERDFRDPGDPRDRDPRERDLRDPRERDRDPRERDLRDPRGDPRDRDPRGPQSEYRSRNSDPDSRHDRNRVSGEIRPRPHTSPGGDSRGGPPPPNDYSPQHTQLLHNNLDTGKINGDAEGTEQRAKETEYSTIITPRRRSKPHKVSGGGGGGGGEHCGEVMLQICYDSRASILYVTVIRARGLYTMRDNGDNTPDPFVKVYLLPGRSLENQRRTRAFTGTSNPDWKQTMVYPGIEPQDLKQRHLEVSAWNQQDGKQPNELLGEVVLNLSEKCVMDESPRWYQLQEPDKDDTIST